MTRSTVARREQLYRAAVKSTDARKRFQLETSVAPTEASKELLPKCFSHIDRRAETALAAKPEDVPLMRQ